MAIGKKLLSVFFSFTLVMGLLPYSAFADPSDSSSNSTESSSDASTSNESEFADGGVASKPDPNDSEGGMDSNGSVSGGEDPEFGADDEFADEQELSASDYSDGKLAIWADGLDDPSDATDVYPPDANEIEAYANGSNLQPMNFSSEMLYFCKYESSCNYDQGLSSGDGYHAMGYFQFDNRYGLGSFLKAVYNYNPSTYSALKVIGDRYGWDVTGATRSNGAFTRLGNDLNTAWHAAYKANPTEFSNLQNGWAYIDSYNGSLGARGCLKAFGINLDNRPDCIKGLCWGMVNLFGAGGGASYINNGNYYGANWFFKNSGINDSMSDEAFVTTLCDYVVNNVAKRYPKQSIYWTGWQNRYKSEKADCLNYLQANVYVIEDKFDSSIQGSYSVLDGEYVVKSKLDGMGVLQADDVSLASQMQTALKLRASVMGDSQKFEFERDGSTGYVRIKCVQSSCYLGLAGSNGRYSQNVIQKNYSENDKTLLWLLKENNGAIVIAPAVNPDYCLDVSSDSFHDGSSVDLRKASGADRQKWSLISTSPEVKGGRTVEDGIYYVGVKADPSQVLDIADASSSDGANLQIWSATGAANQKFRFECGDDGFYTITCLKSGKVLDVDNGNVVPGANVQQWSGYGGDSQKWAVQDDGDGGYRLVCKANGLAIDLTGGSTADGTNVQSWTLNGTEAQSFDISSAKADRAVADGVYVVSAAADPSKVLDVEGGSLSDGARLQVYGTNMTQAQAFRFDYDEETGFYTITNEGSGKVLDAAGGSTSNGTRVQQYAPNGTLAQRWIVSRDGDGVKICSAAAPSQVLDLTGRSSSDGTKVQLWSSSGGSNQLFRLYSASPEKVSPCDDMKLDGVFEIVPASQESLRLDVTGASRAHGAGIQLYNDNATFAQLFRLEFSNGYYRILSVNSGQAVAMSHGSVVPGIQACQEEPSGGDEQLFSASVDDDGDLTFTCKANSLKLGFLSCTSGQAVVGTNSDDSSLVSFKLVKRTDLLKEGLVTVFSSMGDNKVLDVKNGDFSDGANVQLYDGNGTFAQKWNVTKVAGRANSYRFESVCSGKYLTADGFNVCQRELDDSEVQIWTPRVSERGGVVLENSANDKVLDVAGASTVNGTNVQVYGSNGTDAQRFYVDQVDPLQDGMYTLHIGSNYKQVVDVAGGSSSDGANIQSWESNNSGAQKWNIFKNNDGSYRIINAVNGKALDVSEAKAYVGANVQQYTWNGSNAQKWIVRYDREAGFVFESSLNANLVLETSSYDAGNGVNIQLGTASGRGNQRFCLERTTYVPPMAADKQAMQDRIWGYGSGTQWLIAVDRSTYKVGVFKGSANNWSLQYYWSCVTGAPGTPTITGTYRTTGFKRTVLSTDRRARWCTQIWGGYFFHTILASDNELGKSLSHGCLRMSYPSAQWIYNNIYSGTTVTIYN
mgnify:FL=1